MKFYHRYEYHIIPGVRKLSLQFKILELYNYTKYNLKNGFQ